VICRIVFALALCAAAGLRAQTVVPGATTAGADVMAMDVTTGETVMKGNARLSDGTILLLADEIRYNDKTQVATAIGHIAFTRGAVRLLADRLVYDRNDDSFTADNIRVGSYPYFIEGFSGAGRRDEITVERARASYGEPGPWQPTINADRIIFAPGQQLRSEHVTIGIGHAQPVPIPRFDHNLGAPIIGTLALTGGYRRSLGVFADGSLHVPLKPGLRLGADLGIFTNRGLMVGPSGRYFDEKQPERLRGYFRSGYINDHGDKGVDILNRPIPEERAFAEWQHQQLLAPNLTLAVQLNWWKDSEVLRDFRPRAFFPVQEPDTFVESVYTAPNYFVSAFARFQPNRFHRVQERMPEVRFDLLPFAVGNGLYQQFNASAAALREDPLPAANVVLGPTLARPDPFTAVGRKLRADRLDAYYGLSRPFAPTEWFAFTPVAGGRLTHYLNAQMDGVDKANYLRLLGEIGGDVVLRGSGTFDYQNPQWKIDGLRHLVTPRLSYRYIPEADKGRAQIPPIDREAFSTYLQPLGLGAVRNIDELHATNTLRLGIDNTIQTRDAVNGTRDLLVFNVANDFRFRRRPGERDVSEVHTEIALMPAPWLQVDVYQSFAPQNFSLREFNSGVTIRDGRFWSLRFGNNFLRREIQDYSIDGRLRINERFEALTRLHYDARKHRFNEQAYGIVQNLGNTWLISYTVSLYSGRRRESSFGFNVQIDTVRF
jgi:LPS-assembly protein